MFLFSVLGFEPRTSGVLGTKTKQCKESLCIASFPLSALRAKYEGTYARDTVVRASPKLGPEDRLSLGSLTSFHVSPGVFTFSLHSSLWAVIKKKMQLTLLG